jgi:ketosteroid isomerase-like protein
MHPTIARLTDAMNRHDAAGMAALFSPDYHSEQPAHPNREFGIGSQVETNWSRMFAGVPDIRCESVADIDDGSTAWTEWRWTGTHTDGTPFETVGVTVFRIAEDGRIASGHLYMEPVEKDGPAIDETVRRLARTSD